MRGGVDFSVTPGQALVFYRGDEIPGEGRIVNALILFTGVPLRLCPRWRDFGDFLF
jgi:hypothetical protein